MSIDMRELIIKLHQKKKSLAEIAKVIDRPRGTVQSVIKKFKITGSIATAPRNGRPRILSKREERTVTQAVKNNPRISAPKIAAQVELDTGKKVHPENIRRILRKSGYNGRVPRKKPFISDVNRKRRLEFVKSYENRDLDFWKSVLFTDESKYNIFGCDGRGKIWRRPRTALDLKNLLPTVKHGGGSVMVWGSMAAAGVGSLVFINDTMDRWVYLNILKQYLCADAEKLSLGEQWVFQQDQDPKHTAYIVKEWLLYNVPKQLHSPPQSPDLNPIEHVWDYLDRKIRHHHITNKETLKAVLQEEWQQIPANFTESLVSSIPRRLAAVKKAGGGPTKY